MEGTPSLVLIYVEENKGALSHERTVFVAEGIGVGL